MFNNFDFDCRQGPRLRPKTLFKIEHDILPEKGECSVEGCEREEGVETVSRVIQSLFETVSRTKSLFDLVLRNRYHCRLFRSKLLIHNVIAIRTPICAFAISDILNVFLPNHTAVVAA